MKIAMKYSHLNGEEYLIVHHKNLYNEIKKYINNVMADDYKNKVSEEKRKKGKMLYSPTEINSALKDKFASGGWKESRYQYYITLNRDLMEKSLKLPAKEQKEFLVKHGEKDPIYSYNQTDFVKNQIAVEVQFG